MFVAVIGPIASKFFQALFRAAEKEEKAEQELKALREAQAVLPSVAA